MSNQSGFVSGVYHPQTPQKYIGDADPEYRSSWEWKFMEICDTDSNILEWGYEVISIPYTNPSTNETSMYTPDFLVKYKSNQGVVIELIEIKPYEQTVITENTNDSLKTTILINTAKWEAAVKWCQNNGFIFRILTEQELF